MCCSPCSLSVFQFKGGRRHRRDWGSVTTRRISSLRRYHVTDGAFTTADEWAGANVIKTGFTVDGVANAAYLYGQRLGNQFGNLYLMYDFVNGTTANGYDPTVGPVTFNVFFQVPSDGNDYVGSNQLDSGWIRRFFFCADAV